MALYISTHTKLHTDATCSSFPTLFFCDWDPTDFSFNYIISLHARLLFFPAGELVPHTARLMNQLLIFAYWIEISIYLHSNKWLQIQWRSAACLDGNKASVCLKKALWQWFHASFRSHAAVTVGFVSVRSWGLTVSVSNELCLWHKSMICRSERQRWHEVLHLRHLWVTGDLALLNTWTPNCVFVLGHAKVWATFWHCNTKLPLQTVSHSSSTLLVWIGSISTSLNWVVMGIGQMVLCSTPTKWTQGFSEQHEVNEISQLSVSESFMLQIPRHPFFSLHTS